MRESINTPREAAMNRLQKRSEFPVTEGSVVVDRSAGTVTVRLDLEETPLSEEARRDWERKLREQGYTEAANRVFKDSE